MNITAVDLGNYNVKFSGKDANGMFSSRISTDYQSYPEAFQRISMNDSMDTYYIGTGSLQREFNKVNKQFVPQILYSVCRANEGEIIESSLVTLLPIVQMENKSKIINILKNKEFAIKFNEENKVIVVKDVKVLPEGYMSYYSLPETDKRGDICILDIGSRTVNICVLDNGSIQKLKTVKIGSFDFYTQIKDKENSKGNDFQEEDIQRLINNKTIQILPKQYGNFLKEILNTIKPIVNISTYNVIFTGGGSLLLKDSIQKLNLPKYKIMSNPLYSNVVGAKRAAQLIWGTNNGNK